MSQCDTAVSPVTVTKSAALKVWELMQEEGNLELKLRVFVTGGGCSGLQYGFTFDEAANEDDMVIEKAIEEEEGEGGEAGSQGRAVFLLIDPLSFPYLVGAEIDYVENVQGAQFVIRNPNAKTTCGCGSSFSN